VFPLQNDRSQRTEVRSQRTEVRSHSHNKGQRLFLGPRAPSPAMTARRRKKMNTVLVPLRCALSAVRARAPAVPVNLAKLSTTFRLPFCLTFSRDAINVRPFFLPGTPMSTPFSLPEESRAVSSRPENNRHGSKSCPHVGPKPACGSTAHSPCRQILSTLQRRYGDSS
jgi:hypothetical protein